MLSKRPQHGILHALRLAFVKAGRGKAFRLEVGSEDEIPQRKEDGKISIVVLFLNRVMHAVELWAGQQPSRLEADAQIQMNEGGENQFDQQPDHEHLFGRIEDQSDWSKQETLNWPFQPELAVGRCGVHGCIGMVEGMHSPEPWNLVLKPVIAVRNKVCYSDKDEYGNRKMPAFSGKGRGRITEPASEPHDHRRRQRVDDLRKQESAQAGSGIKKSAFRAHAFKTSRKDQRQEDHEKGKQEKHGVSLAPSLLPLLQLSGHQPYFGHFMQHSKRRKRCSQS